jgi:aromatic ring-opening dioxygenase catalytic subunit (LigB family)
MKMPTLYLPHGGGPCFFMDWSPPRTWDRMAEWLRSIAQELPSPPKALVVVSAHWEAPLPTVTAAAAPSLIYDYYGFPPHTYELTWPAPGSPALAARVRELLAAQGIESAADGERGFDHGVFIPLKLALPEANVPTVQLSLRAGLDAAAHLAIGRALAPLRDEGVWLLGSGMSYHNMRGFQREQSRAESRDFDGWLEQAIASAPKERASRLVEWERAPFARRCHPREEHLVPLMVVAGAAADEPGRVVFRDEVMGVRVSAIQFGGA